jgi:hypothetical protein
VSIVLVIPLAKSVGACVFEWFLDEANMYYHPTQDSVQAQAAESKKARKHMAAKARKAR